MTWEEIGNRVKNGEYLIVIENIVHDVKEFFSLHPGGPKFLKAYTGKDATLAFNGRVYDHSNAGRNLRKKLAIAKLKKDN